MEAYVRLVRMALLSKAQRLITEVKP